MAHAHAQEDEGIHGINVTPLVDIMLVLLIIFMVATQIDQPQSIGVDLPNATTATSSKPSTLSIVVGRDGSLKLDGVIATLADIERAAKRTVPAGQNPAENRKSDSQAVVSADKGVPYERVVAVVDAVRRGGVHKLALATELTGGP
jgi:biopolymer transport protein ExbD